MKIERCRRENARRSPCFLKRFVFGPERFGEIFRQQNIVVDRQNEFRAARRRFSYKTVTSASNAEIADIADDDAVDGGFNAGGGFRIASVVDQDETKQPFAAQLSKTLQ